jgi:electron transfer flavoprotein alpha subunit
MLRDMVKEFADTELAPRALEMDNRGEFFWVDESRMIGQSGKTVSPGLFVSLGASGAMHYTTGFMGSKVVLAVDQNPQAPIFQMADIGIVGDLREVLPCLIEELKKDRMPRNL